MSPGVGELTTIVTVALELLVIVPRLHVIVPPPFAQVPRLFVMEMNCTPAGRILVKKTPVKGVRQLLLIVSVYVRLLPTTSGSAEARMLADKSADEKNFATKASANPPLKFVWNAPAVVSKSVESQNPEM